MNKKTALWLTLAMSFVLVGCVVFVGAMTVMSWDFSKLSTVKYETNTYAVTETFHDIKITTDTAIVELVPSEDDTSQVVCYERQNTNHTVTVKDGALVVEEVDTRKWFEYIGVNVATPRITVTIPQGAYGALSIKNDTGDIRIPTVFAFESMDIAGTTGDVVNKAPVLGVMNIKTTTGDIAVENVSVGALNLSVSTGKVSVSSVICEGDASVHVSTGKMTFTDLSCRNFVSDGDTGDAMLCSVIAEDRFAVERNTGDVTLDGCDAAAIIIKTDTGRVGGTLLSDKVFFAQSDTGRVDVPKTVTGGTCEITTNTGNIRIRIEE